jgi:hypothetical protein
LCPLLEGSPATRPTGTKAFFNHVAELVCRHLYDGEWDNKYLVGFSGTVPLPDAFRSMRGGAVGRKATCPQKKQKAALRERLSVLRGF